MQRDLHFLERSAERLDRGEAEFALDLWQHPETLRGLLDGLKLPAEVERVALGLGLDGAGPWLVLTRAGDFVTCLGREMATTGLHVVPASQVAALVARAKARVAEAQLADQRVPETRQAKFLARIKRPGPYFAREDMQVLAAWHDRYCDFYLEALQAQFAVMGQASSLGRAWNRPRAAVEAGIRTYWDAWWGVQTLAPLIAHEARERKLASVLGGGSAVSIGLCGSLPYIVRVAWAAGRFGKSVLPELKVLYRQGRPREQMLAMVALLSIALRHKSLRAEIEKVLYSRGSGFRADNNIAEEAHQSHGEYLDRMFNNTASARERFLRMGREFVVEIGKQKGGAAAERWPTVESVADGTAGPMLSLGGGNCFESLHMLAPVIYAPAWVCDLEAPDLFLAQQDAALLREPYDFADGIKLYRTFHRHLDTREPIRVQKVGRNDPCPCGSGQKFKRCCEGKAAQG